MTANELPHGYTIEVYPLAPSAGHFGWKVRKHGKLYQRSDYAHPAEQTAYAKALARIEQDARGDVRGDRR
jgi:hypothetical protein